MQYETKQQHPGQIENKTHSLFEIIGSGRDGVYQLENHWERLREKKTGFTILITNTQI